MTWPVHDVTDGLIPMIDTGREITRATFRRLVDPDALADLEAALGYAPARARHPGALRMTDDFHVRYFTGRLHGRRAAWVVHSAIEHVFADPGTCPIS